MIVIIQTRLNQKKMINCCNEPLGITKPGSQPECQGCILYVTCIRLWNNENNDNMTSSDFKKLFEKKKDDSYWKS